MILFILSVLAIVTVSYEVRKRTKWHDIVSGYSKYDSYYGAQWITLEARLNGELRISQDDLFCDKNRSERLKGFFIVDHENLAKTNISHDRIKNALKNHATFICDIDDNSKFKG